MNKRHRDSNLSLQEPEFLKGGDRPVREDGEVLDFEDEYEDEFESEDEIFEAGVDGRPDAEREAEEAEAMDVDPGTFIPGRTKLGAGETLEPNLSVYELLHRFSSKWSCLSLDIIKDYLGDNRSTYPATAYAVAGSQAGQGHERENELSVFKLSSLSKVQKEEEGSDSDDDDSDDEESEPVLESKSIPLTSCTNRIRAFQRPREGNTSGFSQTFTASMMESGQVLIYDVTPHLNAFDNPGSAITAAQNQPVSVITAHKSTEGYAIDWSPLDNDGRLLTGDTKGRIFLSVAQPGGKWGIDRKEAFTGHNGSVEELQWSPTEASVFASASSDGTVKIWDTRSKSRKAKVSVKVSEYDVNVLSWSRQTSHLLASGHDDGSWAVWDLRQWRPSSTTAQKPEPVADFHFNKEQITCLEWHPTDDSIIMACAGDNTVTLWDLAVELDDEESKETGGVKEYPPQLLFLHYQEGVKEGHWHPQIPGAVFSTGLGFDFFKTISV
ncbi:uncharacterized protein PV09_08858 [Verruconis gallopava]|uniref:Glutamate-rich WD repeat-containing protein 1 n=1 Tax=Verruconis gallopava TaxID=253628 RepID=A0A0D1YF95_9PEZI|nr:uncharacterized protein PV09_08858 [Verruconis gallopava]KIV99426.1 hypothetical protein PV09_08858 [Verruconis gallopava]